MFIIMMFIAILNVVAMALTYYCLEDTEKREKIIFIAVGVAIIYILTSFTYGITTKEIEIRQVSEQCKTIIVSLFVPINSIVVLTMLAKSYRKYKKGRLKKEQLRNRIIILAILLVMLLTLELSYFKGIQNQVIKVIEKNRQELNKESIHTNTIENNTTNEISNEIINTNIVSEEQISNVIEENVNFIENNIID